jgi:hypothetical protein
VLIRTGWGRRWHDARAFVNEQRQPGISLDAAQWLSAQGVYANPYYYSAPQGYAGYNGYAYSPGYVARSWDYPAGYDTSGMAYSYRDLGWRPDGTVCYPTQRAQNRC